MADIKERLAKLARLVSYDEEARSTCEDAIKEIEKLEDGNAAKVASTYVSTTGGYFVWGQTPPPGPKTQVKWDSVDLDLVTDLYMFGNAMIHFYVDENGDMQTRRVDPNLLKMNDDGWGLST